MINIKKYIINLFINNYVYLRIVLFIYISIIILIKLDIFKCSMFYILFN